MGLPTNPKKVVDLVVYTTDGEPKVIGECEVEETSPGDGIISNATITDPELSKKMLDCMGLSVSVAPEKPLELEGIRRNIFDDEKKDKA